MKKFLALLVLAGFLFPLGLALAQEMPTLEQCVLKHDIGARYAKCEKDCEAEEAKGEVKPEDVTVGSATGNTCVSAICCLIDKVETIVDWFFVVVLTIAVVMIMIGAFQFLIAGGDPGKVGKARDYLLYALIGIAVAFFAKGFIRVIFGIIA